MTERRVTPQHLSRRPDTSATAADQDTRNARRVFDAHLNRCDKCSDYLCSRADALWREVCLTALRAAQKGGA